MNRNEQPFWMRRLRVMLRRTNSAALILSRDGPVAREGAFANVGDGEILIGWYGSDVSDEQLMDDVAGARVELVQLRSAPQHRAAA